MKVSKDFILREIADECMLVPTGHAAAKCNGLITLNELGAFIFRTLAQEHTRESLLNCILEEYDVDRETASNDLDAFLQQLRELDALLEA